MEKASIEPPEEEEEERPVVNGNGVVTPGQSFAFVVGSPGLIDVTKYMLYQYVHIHIHIYLQLS